MSQEDNPSPQGDSTSKTPLPSATPKNQANSTPATESEEPNNLTAETLSEEGEGIVEECGRFKERLHNIKELPHNINKYITEDNPILDSNETNKKYPIDTLVSIFKIQKKDHKIIFWISVLLLTHMISYYLKWIYLVDLFRIAITAIFLIFAIKNTYSAYQNRPIIVDSFKKHPLQFFTTIIAIGGLFALVIPAAMNVLKLIGDSSALTTAILTITGGFIAVFGLIKSHQKSELEREQLETQKQKDARDHIRQLHDSYNDRFDKAVAELYSNDVKAAYAAVPKLAKLADAWLDYKDLSNDTEELEKLKKKAEKEAQTIINILCKYIRTMPGEYTEEDLKDIGALDTTHQDKLKSESEVRRLIFSEISARSSTVTVGNDKISITPGVWSEFNFDFTKAPIFYPLYDLTFENPNFEFARFYTEIDFSNSCFIGKTSFESVHFVKNLKAHINFSSTKFIGNVSFLNAQFDRFADFELSNFRQEASFENATFDESAYFKNARFKKSTLFSMATFTGPTDFTNVTFSGSVGFGLSTFENSVDFSNAIFITPVNFSATCFNYESPEFAKYSAGAMFCNKIHPKKYIFDVAKNSKYKIETGRVIQDNQPFDIPLGSVLFDPDSWDKENQEYTRFSDPAKPIEESDNQGETPSN